MLLNLPRQTRTISNYCSARAKAMRVSEPTVKTLPVRSFLKQISRHDNFRLQHNYSKFKARPG